MSPSVPRSTAAAPGAGVYDPPSPRRTWRVPSADGTSIHVEEHGPKDAPTVLLSHGWTCSTLFWAPVIRELSTGLRVVAYDQRGHGRSAAPERGGYSTTALADDLSAVLQSAVPDGRAVLAGHSMGGMTLMAAATRPAVRSRTAAALLASTGSSNLTAGAEVVPSRVPLPWLRTAVQRLLLTAALPLGPVTALSRAGLKYMVLSPIATREMVEATARIVHACPTRTRSSWGRVLARLDVDAGLAALEAPTAILVGTADRLTPPPHAHRMAARLPHCTGVTELTGLGHMTPIEDPAAVVAAIRGLVADHLVNEGGHAVAEEGRTA